MSKVRTSIFLAIAALFLIPFLIAASADFEDGTEVSGSFIDHGYIEINVSSENSTNITIYLYNLTEQINFSEALDSNYTSINWTVGEGTYYFNASSIDNESNINWTETRNVRIDLFYPIVVFDATDNGTINRTYIMINATATDIYLQNLTLYIYNSSNDIIENISTDEANISLNYTNLSEQTYYFNASACDFSGKCNTSDTWNVTIILADEQPPTITINSPLQSVYNTTEIIFNVTIDENGTCEYNIDEGLNMSMETTDYRTFNATNYSMLEGMHSIIFICNDMAGNANESNLNFTIDTIAPSIEIISPSNVTYNTSLILVNISSSEADMIWFFNGTQNQTYNGSIFIEFTEGEHILYAYANDSAGNSNSTQINFSVNTSDSTYPIINISSPLQEYYNSTVLFNVSLDENGSCMYSIDDGSNMSMETTDNLTFNATNNTMTEGLHNITFICNDTFGNTNISRTNITVDTLLPSISVYSPGASSSSSNVLFNVSASDANIYNITLYVYYTNNSLRFNSSSTSLISTTLNLADGSYKYNVTAYDLAGNFNYSSRNLTVSTYVAPPEDEGGSGGGGSSGGSSTSVPYVPSNTANKTIDPKIKMSWMTLPAGNRVINNENPQIPITYITLSLNSSSENRTSLEAIIKDNNPFNQSLTDNVVYKYVYINTTINNSRINGTEIRFYVNKTWLKENNINASDVILYQFNDSGWQRTETSISTSDDNNFYFTSRSSSLLSFAISGSHVSAIINQTNESMQESFSAEKISGEQIIVNEKVGIFKSIGTGMMQTINATGNKLSSIHISEDGKFLIIMIIGAIMLLVVGTITGILLYNRFALAREERIMRRELRAEKKIKNITSYEEEPLSTSKIVSVEKMSQSQFTKPIANSDMYIKKIEQLLMQTEYALDNGKLEDAKKFFEDAKSIYFHSNLDYSHKERVYNKIIEISRRIK